MNDLEIRQRDRGALREGYGPAVRRFEIASILAYVLAMAWLLVDIAPRIGTNPFLALSALMLGFVAADFLSGFIHWMADTWGTPDWPIIGRGLIRPFREHHVDQKEITRHDFVETNGNNCFISLPVAVGAALLPDGTAWFFVAAMTFSICLTIMGTNQFHKWAHMDAPPRYVRMLQRANLILPPDHHAVHHTGPYAKYYCITVGWLNEALFRLRFFQTLEKLITLVSGVLPREDDIGKGAALLVAQQPPPPLPELPKIVLPSIDLPDVSGQPVAKSD
jgi:ubiquitin-conjugating enzyme E2 variant